MKFRRILSTHGFTITELLVVMAISGIAMGAISLTYGSQQKAFKITGDVTAIQQNLRAAMISMDRDLKMAGYDPEVSNAFGFTSITANAVSFTWDEDEDGQSGTTEYISYQHSAGGNTLQRDDGSGFVDIADNISGVTFLYFDVNGNSTGTTSDVRSVEITLSASRGGHNKEMNSRILCRNLGL